MIKMRPNALAYVHPEKQRSRYAKPIMAEQYSFGKKGDAYSRNPGRSVPRRPPGEILKGGGAHGTDNSGAAIATSFKLGKFSPVLPIPKPHPTTPTPHPHRPPAYIVFAISPAPLGRARSSEVQQE